MQRRRFVLLTLAGTAAVSIPLSHCGIGDETDRPEFLHSLIGKDKTIEYNLLDRYDAVTKTSSMARTTGYTCTAAVNLISKGLFNEKGVFPPELVGKHKNCFEFVMKYLDERKVTWKKNKWAE